MWTVGVRTPCVVDARRPGQFVITHSWRLSGQHPASPALTTAIQRRTRRSITSENSNDDDVTIMSSLMVKHQLNTYFRFSVSDW